MAKIRILLVAEMDVDPEAPIEDGQDQLDAFREATEPCNRYGISLYRASLNIGNLPGGLIREGWDTVEESP
jgi:hypothetical protein